MPARGHREAQAHQGSRHWQHHMCCLCVRR